jgi:hypothetical protein
MPPLQVLHVVKSTPEAFEEATATMVDEYGINSYGCYEDQLGCRIEQRDEKYESWCCNSRR